MSPNQKYVAYDEAATFFDTVGAARFLKLHPVTLRTWRSQRNPIGPHWRKSPTGTVRYHRDDLLAWLGKTEQGSAAA